MCKRYIDRLPLRRPQLGTWPASQARALTGNRTGDPSVHGLSFDVRMATSHTSQRGQRRCGQPEPEVLQSWWQVGVGQRGDEAACSMAVHMAAVCQVSFRHWARW